MATDHPRPPERIYAGYFAAQAAVGVGLWVAFASSTTARGWFDLLPAHRPVTSSFFLADLLVAVLGSAASAWAFERSARWLVPVVAFTAGGMAYPTLYLVSYVTATGTGKLDLAMMIPPSTITCLIACQTWWTQQAHR